VGLGGGVGVAPAIPALGDRRASGHNIIGLAVFDRSALRADAIGRCWSAVHGAVALELKGLVCTPDPEATYSAVIDTIVRGLAPQA